MHASIACTLAHVGVPAAAAHHRASVRARSWPSTIAAAEHTDHAQACAWSARHTCEHARARGGIPSNEQACSFMASTPAACMRSPARAEWARTPACAEASERSFEAAAFKPPLGLVPSGETEPVLGRVPSGGTEADGHARNLSHRRKVCTQHRRKACTQHRRKAHSIAASHARGVRFIVEQACMLAHESWRRRASKPFVRKQRQHASRARKQRLASKGSVARLRACKHPASASIAERACMHARTENAFDEPALARLRMCMSVASPHVLISTDCTNRKASCPRLSSPPSYSSFQRQHA